MGLSVGAGVIISRYFGARNMDRNWIEHIDMMDKLRNGIHLRAYAQNNPLQAYIEEGYEMFEEMQARIAREVVFLWSNDAMTAIEFKEDVYKRQGRSSC